MYLLIKRKVCVNFNNYKIESILQSTKCQYLFFINWFFLYLWLFLAFAFRTEGKNDFVSFQKLYVTFTPITSTMTTFAFSPDGRCIIWEFDLFLTRKLQPYKDIIMQWITYKMKTPFTQFDFKQVSNKFTADPKTSTLSMWFIFKTIPFRTLHTQLAFMEGSIQKFS